MQVDRALLWLSDVHCACDAVAAATDSWLDDGLVNPLPRELMNQFAISRESVVGSLFLALERFTLRGELTVGPGGDRSTSFVTAAQIFVTTGTRGSHAAKPGPADLLVVSLAFDLHQIDDPDVLIALIQSFETVPRVGALSVRYQSDQEPRLFESTSLHDFMRWCASLLLARSRDVEPEKFRILELRGLRDVKPDRLSLARSDSVKYLYGVLAGDEGWRDVPRAHALEVLERGWNSSRAFLRVVFFGHSTLVLNEKFDGSYVSNADAFYRRMFGRTDPYFHTDFALAGLDHGVLPLAERNTYWIATARDLRRQFQELIPDDRSSSGRGGASLSLAWWTGLSGRLRSARLDQVRFRGSLPAPSVAELENMEDALFRESGLSGVVQDLDSAAASMDDVAFGLTSLRVSIVILAVAFVTLFVALAALLYPVFF